MIILATEIVKEMIRINFQSYNRITRAPFGRQGEKDLNGFVFFPVIPE